MDLASFAGVDYLDATLDGETYRVGELTFAEWAPVQAWIKATVPGPLSVLEGPDFAALPFAEREAIRRIAFESKRAWPPAIASLAWFRALDHPGGHVALFRALLGKHQPGITPERCAELAARLTLGEVAPLVAAGLGLYDPKATTPPPTNRKARRKAGAKPRATRSGPPSPDSPSPSGGRRPRRSG